MPKYSLEFEAQYAIAVFGDSLGCYGSLAENPAIVDIAVDSDGTLTKHRKYLDNEGIAYKVNGRPFNNPVW